MEVIDYWLLSIYEILIIVYCEKCIKLKYDSFSMMYLYMHQHLQFLIFFKDLDVNAIFVQVKVFDLQRYPN